MDMNNTLSQVTPVAPLPQTAAPPPATPDGRPVADASALSRDPTPEVPMPIPASPSQTALVSKAALPEKESPPGAETSGPSSAARVLKPYGISMLPEKGDAPKQEVPPEA
ncbi:hypothetical protein [Thalassorhabdomicrobium marinisediminis]|uniref:hypothetical protein n=1 Tax=Thalassorhabdomicrobium marinisediminis TaxID=2170577 RepID=UPI002491AE3A|nr:hypothetical protein [Thalassorhabdomicrobium marinisediminis]